LELGTGEGTKGGRKKRIEGGATDSIRLVLVCKRNPSGRSHSGCEPTKKTGKGKLGIDGPNDVKRG